MSDRLRIIGVEMADADGEHFSVVGVPGLKPVVENQSVLDARVVASALKSLSPTKRRKAVDGLRILADASSDVRQASRKARR